jgi:hypothetical protein
MFAPRRLLPLRLAKVISERLTSTPAKFTPDRLAFDRSVRICPMPWFLMLTPMRAPARSAPGRSAIIFTPDIFAAVKIGIFFTSPPSTTTDSRLAPVRSAPGKSAPVSQAPLRLAARRSLPRKSQFTSSAGEQARALQLGVAEVDAAQVEIGQVLARQVGKRRRGSGAQLVSDLFGRQIGGQAHLGG